MQERRLAAIMFTYLVGYTALMGLDEDRAFEVLAKNRKIHSILIYILSGVFRRRPRVFTKQQHGIFFITFACYRWIPLIEMTQGYDLVYKWLISQGLLRKTLLGRGGGEKRNKSVIGLRKSSYLVY